MNGGTPSTGYAVAVSFSRIALKPYAPRVAERGTSKRERAEAQAEVEVAKAAIKYQFRTHVVDSVKWVMVVVASWIPLQAMAEIVHNLAGKNTVVDANMVVSLSFAYSVVATVGWAASAARGRRRKESLEALRQRTDGVESKLIGKGGS
jgi:hypothetical protein